MKSVVKFVLVAVLALTMATAALAANVTFQLDMSVQIALGNFDAGTQSVVVRGSFNGWAGDANALTAAGDGLYTGTWDLAAGEIQYKFVIPTPETWESVDNRIATVGTEPLVIPVVFFNNVTSATTADVEVRFRVDMQVQDLSGTFDPATDWIVVRGNHANIGSWGGATQLFEETLNPGIYSAWITFDALPTNAPIEYKFVILNNGDVNDASWESSANRSFTPTGTESDNLPPPSGNGYGEISPEVVYFANIGPDDIITNDLDVVFQVDVRPLLGRLRDLGYIYDVQTQDTIYTLETIGVAGYFNNWPWGNFSPDHQLNDNGINGDVTANDSIWSRSIPFAAGSPRNLIYKYGGNMLDVEAGFAMNHEQILDDNQATYYVPAVCWGSQDTLYNPWQVECSVPVGEQPEVTTPSLYTLSQNYPNPFNPSTTIAFNLPRQDVMTLHVFDLLGREVVTLNLGSLNAGSHEIHFDGSDLASGLYFYRLESPNFNATRKMLLMK